MCEASTSKALPLWRADCQRLTEQLHCVQQDNAELARALRTLQDRERQHLGQNLHDDVGQYVVALRAQIQLLSLLAEQPQRVRDIAETLEQHASQMQHSLQAVVGGLYPVNLGSMHLAQLLQRVQNHWQQLHGGQCSLHILNVPPPLTLAQTQQLYQLLQEVLSNAKRHGRATHLHLWLQYKQQTWRIVLRDNGQGGELNQNGIGLHSIHARAQALSAQVHIQARPTRGWSLYLYAPLVSESDENTFS